jgi:hypothetical protein
MVRSAAWSRCLLWFVYGLYNDEQKARNVPSWKKCSEHSGIRRETEERHLVREFVTICWRDV